MTEHERDPALSGLFANATEDLDGESFTQAVMDETIRLRRRHRMGWIALGVVAVLMAFVMQDLVVDFSQALAHPLFTIDHRLMAEMLAPVNSIGGLLSMAVLALRLAYRRIFN
ncbi:MAG: hypothetical protein QNJ40_06875 [Xanthomonadales bacterium]|nr:hypothetical protein [Xanthomonadales bacterium]